MRSRRRLTSSAGKANRTLNGSVSARRRSRGWPGRAQTASSSGSRRERAGPRGCRRRRTGGPASVRPGRRTTDKRWRRWPRPSEGCAHLLDREAGTRAHQNIGQRPPHAREQFPGFQMRRVSVRTEVGRDKPGLIRVSETGHSIREQHRCVGQQHLPRAREVLREQRADRSRVEPEALNLVVRVFRLDRV